MRANCSVLFFRRGSRTVDCRTIYGTYWRLGACAVAAKLVQLHGELNKFPDIMMYKFPDMYKFPRLFSRLLSPAAWFLWLLEQIVNKLGRKLRTSWPCSTSTRRQRTSQSGSSRTAAGTRSAVLASARQSSTDGSRKLRSGGIGIEGSKAPC